MKSRKIISTILASAMVFGLVPGFVFASETEETDIPEIIIEEEEPEETEAEETPATEEEILEEEVIPEDLEEEPEEVEEEQAEEIIVEEADEEEVDALSGTCGENATWTYDEETKTLTISGEGEMYSYWSDDTPWDDYHREIENLVIEEGITNVGESAFWGCGKLENVSLPETLLTIDREAFAWCESLVSITIPDSVTSINGFGNCSSLEDVVFGEDTQLETISTYAFSCCYSLKYFTIPASVTEIEEDSFYYTAIEDIYCYADYESLTWNDTSNESYKHDKKTYVHVYSEDFDGFADKFSSVNVTFVGDLDAYENHLCGDHAYYYFDTETGTLSIRGSGEMSDYSSFGESPWYSFKDEITSIIVEDGITSIGEYCFKDLENVETVSLPDGLTGIGLCAFSSCDGLTEITLPESLKYIGADAFSMCTGVTDVYCYLDPDNLTWDINDEYNCFQEDGATRLHICYEFEDAFPEKFPDLDVTYVPDKFFYPCGDACGWTYDADTKTLTISGEGKMYSYWKNQ